MLIANLLLVNNSTNVITPLIPFYTLLDSLVFKLLKDTSVTLDLNY